MLPDHSSGRNPEVIPHSLCAFDNDFHNWGGGYLVIGVGEKAGKPLLPPKRLEPGQVDSIQKKLVEICSHAIQPAQFPIVVPLLGLLALVGLAAGWYFAAGGMAFSNLAALGGLAMSGDWALGGLSFGVHANDSVALTHARTDPAILWFLRLAPLTLPALTFLKFGF